MFAVRFSACLKLLREGACFNEDGSRFHANGPLYLKVVLPISKLNLGDIKELVFRKLYLKMSLKLMDHKSTDLPRIDAIIPRFSVYTHM